MTFLTSFLFEAIVICACFSVITTLYYTVVVVGLLKRNLFLLTKIYNQGLLKDEKPLPLPLSRTETFVEKLKKLKSSEFDKNMRKRETYRNVLNSGFINKKELEELGEELLPE